MDTLGIDCFPWYEKGLKQLTYAQLALTNSTLMIKVVAIDQHASGTRLDANTSVYLDSCFEFFLSPQSKKRTEYINFEINCIGTMYLAYNTPEGDKCATLDQINEVSIKTSFDKGVVKQVSASDSEWTLEIEIPLSLIEDLYGEPISEERWYGNFYRCGGDVDPQYAVWNPITWDVPSFHQPLQFGQLDIVDCK